VVKEVEWCGRQHYHSTFASTDTRSAGGYQAGPIDPTGLVPVVNEVEWCERQPPSTFAPTDTRSAGGKQACPIDPTGLAPVVNEVG
jgi:hypothetical protein